MPKILIREYDNSTTGAIASNNFSVVVPGYFGEHTGDETDILIGHDVYELKSQSDFETYVGKHAFVAEPEEGIGPVLDVLREPSSTNNYNDYTKYLKAITPADLDIYLQEDNNKYIYQAIEITDSADPRFGKKGYLYTTLEYKQKISQQKADEEGKPLYEDSEEVDENGDPIQVPVMEWVESDESQFVTLRFEKISTVSEIEWTTSNGFPTSLYANYCFITEGEEGAEAVQDSHIGNQIAYELLGLGYTVLYKKISPIETVDAQGNPTLISKNAVLDQAPFWEPLKDKSIFNFRYIMTGGYYSAAAMNHICALAKFNNNISLENAETYGNSAGRGDCIALCDLEENYIDHPISSSLPIKTLIENLGYAASCIQSNECSAIFGPRVIYNLSDNSVRPFGKNKTFPASFHYLACAARAFSRYNEWYAVAGYNRGISNYTIDKTTVKLGEIAVNTLAPRIANDYTTKSVNLILNERGNYYLWGNRTGYTLDGNGLVFNHFLNIRQLCCSIKKQLYTACRQFTFDPNSDLLWINFVNAIKPLLETMRADQGIKGYTITRVANDKKALLTAKIRIVPIEAVEDFDISIYLEDSLTGIVVNASEA